MITISAYKRICVPVFAFMLLSLFAYYAQSQPLIEAQKNLYQHEKSLKTVDSDRFIIVAHRGAVVNDTLLENSIEGLEEAIRRGYTHMEVDLRTTKDGHVVCFHERNLSEITGIDKNVDDLTLDELKAIADSMGAQIFPTFEEYCARCQGRIDLMPDIKRCYNLSTSEYVSKIKEPVINYGLMEHALIIGENLHSFWGQAKIAWRSTAEAMINWKNNNHKEPADYYFVFNHARDFNQQQVDLFHSMGVKIVVSINTFHYESGDPVEQGHNDIRKMLEYGVDGLQIDSIYDGLVFSLTSVNTFAEASQPTQYVFNQNYPNPFNAMTTIEFRLPDKTHVALAIFNVFGQAVKTLVDEEFEMGSYRMHWDGTNDYGRMVESGVYFYQLQANNFSEVRRMIFLK